MSRTIWKAGNMLYPVPPVLVTVKSGEAVNILTIAWTGTICSDPPMCYISVRSERLSYHMLKESRTFCINLPTRRLLRSIDICGIKSGRDINKIEFLRLETEPCSQIDVPLLTLSPVNIECRIQKIVPLGSHDMFISNVLAVDVDPALIDSKGKLRLEKAGLITYAHGQYYALSESLGRFGFSVKKAKQDRPHHHQ